MIPLFFKIGIRLIIYFDTNLNLPVNYFGIFNFKFLILNLNCLLAFTKLLTSKKLLKFFNYYSAKDWRSDASKNYR